LEIKQSGPQGVFRGCASVEQGLESGGGVGFQLCREQSYMKQRWQYRLWYEWRACTRVRGVASRLKIIIVIFKRQKCHTIFLHEHY